MVQRWCDDDSAARLTKTLLQLMVVCKVVIAAN